MNKYNGLLASAVTEYSLVKGASEVPNQWKARVIYSILGRMAVASVFDMPEEESTSIVHMKHRVERLLGHYKEMYPEVCALLPENAEELSSEIYDIYLHTGVIYHEPNRVIMSARTESKAGNIRFTRGVDLETRQCISGLGTYIKEKGTGQQSISDLTLADMFQLNTVHLQERWSLCIDRARWVDYTPETKTEYLRMSPPFSRGYWVDKPTNSGIVSLMRTGYRGSQLYYLYRVENNVMQVSQLPQWQVDNYNYRSLSNACLYTEGVLPTSKYSIDGELVFLSFGYLPPPAELYLWKLYTWPSSMAFLPRDFNRICMRQVFESIKETMQQQGYVFTKE